MGGGCDSVLIDVGLYVIVDSIFLIDESFFFCISLDLLMFVFPEVFPDALQTRTKIHR